MSGITALSDKQKRRLKPVFDRAMPEGSLFRRIYWELIPWIHRLHRYQNPNCVHLPCDPFEIEYVDPNRVRRFTGRECPHYKNNWEQIGLVEGGNWDVRDDVPGVFEYEGNDFIYYLADTDCSLSIAKRFEETMFHRSMEAHFLDGVPWEDTRIVREAIERLQSSDRDTLWHSSSSPSEIIERCHKIDDLYESMKQQGCIPKRELNAAQGYVQSFSSTAVDEVLVDVGRDGELLFVDGRHRLSVAKILDLNEIPVLKRVRHSRYVDRQ